MRLLSLLAAGFVAFLPAVARAGDPAPAGAPAATPASTVEEATAQVVALEAAVKEHKDKADVALLTKDIPAVAKAHKDCGDAKLKARLMNLLGAILDATKDEPLSKATLAAMGKLGDADAWRFLKEVVKQPNLKEAPPLLVDAILASGKVKAEPAIDVLLSLLDKTKVNSVGIAAMKALSSFGDSKRYRWKILEGVVTSIRRSIPGRANGQSLGGGATVAGSAGDGGTATSGGDTSGDGGGGGIDNGGQGGGTVDGGTSGGTSTAGGVGTDAQSRWRALSPVMVATMDTLTGQKIGTPQDWFDMFDRYKKTPDTLFTTPAAK